VGSVGEALPACRFANISYVCVDHVPNIADFSMLTMYLTLQRLRRSHCRS